MTVSLQGTSRIGDSAASPTGGRTRPTRRIGMALVLAAAVFVAGGLQILDANPATSQTTAITALRVDDGPGTDPTAGVWDRVPEVEVPLTAQQTAYPFGGGTVPAVTAQAVHDDNDLYLRVTWQDTTSDVGTDAPDDFADGLAVQFPAQAASSVPAVCMGQADSGVNIWHWRADSDAGPPETAEEVSPNAVVDIPEDADDDFPARVVGNPFADAGAGAVQNLIAEGFGTLSPADDQRVEGHGEYDDKTWSVVYARELESEAPDQPAFVDGEDTDMAFAVWDGDNDDRNGQKSVSAFATLSLSDDTVPGEGSRWIVPFVALLLAAAVITIARFGSRKSA